MATKLKPRDMNIASPVPGQMVVYDNDGQFSTVAGGGGGVGGSIASGSFAFSPSANITITHSLGLSQADVEAGRYYINFFYTYTLGTPAGRKDVHVRDAQTQGAGTQAGVLNKRGTAFEPYATNAPINWQTNDVRIQLPGANVGPTIRRTIFQNR